MNLFSSLEWEREEDNLDPREAGPSVIDASASSQPLFSLALLLLLLLEDLITLKLSLCPCSSAQEGGYRPIPC